MNQPSSAQIARAKRLLAHEGAAGSVDDDARTAAGRVYDKLHAHLAPLMGDIGVQSLFVRSAKLAAQGEFACLAEISSLGSSIKVRECLEAQDPMGATESAAVLLGTFFALITTLIGERLTTQVLRSAWPTIEELALREADK
jgi:hypothetical protein